MAVELSLNGLLDVTFMDIKTGVEVSEETEQEILDKLMGCEWTIGLASKTVSSYDDLTKPLYKFEFDVTHVMEYEWDEL